MGRPLVVFEVSTGHSVLAGTLSFRAQLSPALTTSHLSSSWMLPFENALPIRRPAAYKGQHNFAGLWWCASNQRHVGFESWCERDQLMRLDFDPDVTGVASQPFRIFLRDALPQTSHVPGYFVRNADGSAIVIDVRPDAPLSSPLTRTYSRPRPHSASVRWGYQRLGALPSVHAASLRWIAGYRHPRCSRDEITEPVLALLKATGPQSLRELASEIGDPICALPTIFHLMWRHQVITDLMTTPLHLESKLWMASP